MSILVSSVLSFLMAYRYFSLFVITFFAAFLFPLPSNLSVLTASTFTNQGLFNIYFIWLVALAGNVSGDLAMYGLARRYGRHTLEKFVFFRKLFASSKYDHYTERMQHYAPITIVVSRFITEINPLVNIISGVIPIPFLRYFKYEFLGECLVVTTFTLAGFFLGIQGQTVVETATWLLLAAISTWIVVNIAKKVIQIRRAEKALF